MNMYEVDLDGRNRRRRHSAYSASRIEEILPHHWTAPVKAG